METNKYYISYSQYKMFNSSRKSFYNKYVLKEEGVSTKWTRFGKNLMESIEFVTQDYDKGVWKNVSRSLKESIELGQVEEKLEAYIDENEKASKSCLGILDVLDLKENYFIEIKTGKVNWDEARLMKDEQVLFYAMLYRANFRKIPTCKLLYLETYEDLNGDVKFTNNVVELERNFTNLEIDEFECKVIKTIHAIDDCDYTELSLENEFDSRLLELMSEKKRIEEEIAFIKDKIMLDMIDSFTNNASTENFNISLATRKTYKYSDELSKEIKDTSSILKQKKVVEEKNGTAELKESKYLIIKTKK